jgi:chromosome partitioning protein
VLRLVISNQRGGVAKTTTATTLARYLADLGQRVLLIDTDPQGSCHTILGLKPQNFLYNYLIQKLVFRECITEALPNIHLLASNRATVEAETVISAYTAREMTLLNVLSQVEMDYDAVIIDVAPSINLLQTCAMVYARTLLVPVAMDTLSLQGAWGSLVAADTLNKALRVPEPIRAVAFLPVMVNRRLAMTELVMKSLDELSTQYKVPILTAVRTDQAVNKCARSRSFLADYDPKSKALEDYEVAFGELLALLGKTDAYVKQEASA